MQFGSSTQAVFFKMRVAGVLHIFQFETKQGEDICLALQTHINDIMMKRYSKVRIERNWACVLLGNYVMYLNSRMFIGQFSWGSVWMYVCTSVQVVVWVFWPKECFS